jgi:hypothetical protein
MDEFTFARFVPTFKSRMMALGIVAGSPMKPREQKPEIIKDIELICFRFLVGFKGPGHIHKSQHFIFFITYYYEMSCFE